MNSSIDGAGFKTIVNTLNSEHLVTNRGKRFNTTLIRGILTNEVYIGVYAWGKKTRVRIEDNHEALIAEDDFRRVQRVLKRKGKPMHSRRIKSRYLLSGLAKCGYCGLAMVGRSAKSGQYLYEAIETAAMDAHLVVDRLKELQMQRSLLQSRIEAAQEAQ